MAEIMSVLKSAKMATDFFKMIDSGSIASMFADVEFAAAREAFLRIPTAVDKIAQARACIIHLTSSYHWHDSIIQNQKFYNSTLMIHTVRLQESYKKARFLLCVRAICHAYVNEHFNCVDDLKLAKEYEMKVSVLGAAWAISALALGFNPFATVDFFFANIRSIASEKYDYAIDKETIALIENAIFANPNII